MNRSQRRSADRAARRGRTATALSSAAVLAAAGGGAAAVLASAPAGANATIVVDSLADSVATDGVTTLREAIVAANTTGGKDVITFSVTGTITLTADLPAIDEALDVTGPGSGSLTIDGDNSFRGFYFGSIDAAEGTSSLTGLSIVDTESATVGAAVAWQNSSGDFLVSDVVVDGSHSASNGGAFEIFYNTGSVTLTDVTVTDSSSGINGGALYSDAKDDAPFDLTITSSRFSDNTATVNGGGLVLNSVNATLTDVTVTGNESEGWGGGGGIWISSYTTATISDSTIDDNLVSGANADGGGIVLRQASLDLVASSVSGNEARTGGGGGIWTNGPGRLTVERSTISGNTSGNYGGGLYLRQYYDVTITNSTISDNTADQAGGVYQGDNAGLTGLTVVQSTITGNRAVDAVNPPATHGLQIGGGPAAGSVGVPAGTVELIGSILAGNGDLDVGTMPDKLGTVRSRGSILGAVDDPVTVTDLGGTQTGVSAAALKLGPLADNGGPTRTHALLAGSPAIDAGPNPPATFPGDAWDQRGAGYARVQYGRVDVGAFEVQESTPEPTFTG